MAYHYILIEDSSPSTEETYKNILARVAKYSCLYFLNRHFFLGFIVSLTLNEKLNKPNGEDLDAFLRKGQQSLQRLPDQIPSSTPILVKYCHGRLLEQLSQPDDEEKPEKGTPEISRHLRDGEQDIRSLTEKMEGLLNLTRDITRRKVLEHIENGSIGINEYQFSDPGLTDFLSENITLGSDPENIYIVSMKVI